jgi:hypothetical protein
VPKLWLRILFFVVLAASLMALAWMGSAQRREEREERINAERRAQPSATGTQPAL